MRKAKIITQTRENPAGTQLSGPVFCPALSVAFFGGMSWEKCKFS